ncbi:MAG: hypothetical protein K2X49_07220, partial [Acetobacteraceae bacterium]|nr:hypothetical protein [Acetobacteraceae bacterium]
MALLLAVKLGVGSLALLEQASTGRVTLVAVAQAEANARPAQPAPPPATPTRPAAAPRPDAA